MAEAEVITAVGRNKKSIKAGDTVKYVNSDTISRVTEIKKDEQGNVWVLLESTDLWYKEETLEPTELATGNMACAAAIPSISLHCFVTFNAPAAVVHVGAVLSVSVIIWV